ncbi:thiamine diphosphate-binding protein [Truncatella angustata]|uniref:Pyruvate decarboxylase n=1 Tax=Truncatella angustata TaxID=152316 RepID=A0A9P8UPT0_9PEZI|nr:thiamine diphosphate-binding protein [Truncatella angustata]KAH6655970.1 thiamine diphosphate-binding protein [Truncatella angustata]
MLPVAQGTVLAQRELDATTESSLAWSSSTVLSIGDGCLQMMVQELGTIIRHNLNVFIFLMKNSGYTIESCIHGLEQKYNDVAPWRYLQTPGFFGAEEGTFTAAVRTFGELQAALNDELLQSSLVLRMVEVFTGREDAPTRPLTSLLENERMRLASQRGPSY